MLEEKPMNKHLEAIVRECDALGKLAQQIGSGQLRVLDTGTGRDMSTGVIGQLARVREEVLMSAILLESEVCSVV